VAFTSEALTGRHVTGQFDSGKPDLDTWLQKVAGPAQRTRLPG
jgi:hypothetical protein